MDNLNYVGEIETPSEKIKSQLMINIIEGRHYYKSNLDTYVVVEIPSYFIGKTMKFIIDLPTLLLDDLMSLRVIMTVYESHKLPSLLSKTILGRTAIEISTIWSEPNKLFHNKWLTLVDLEKDDFGIKGYLRCDIVMFYESKLVHNLSTPKPLDITVTDTDIKESNLLIPNGFKMAPTHLARYSLKLYNGEMMRHLFDGNSKKFLSIGFGEAPESGIMLNISGPELNWNKEYSTINLYPPLCPTVIIKLIFSGNIVARKTLSIHDFTREDGLPCFGPAFLYFMSLETQQYFGKIFISIKTELVPSEIENIKSYQIENIKPIPNQELLYFKIIIIGLIFCVNQVHKNLIESNNMSISLNYEKYNLTSEYETNSESVNIQTPEYKGVNVDSDFYKFPIEGDTKPCLFLVTRILGIEYYTMFAMNLLSKTMFNMETCILTTLKRLNSHKSNINKVEIVREMLNQLYSYHQRFQNLYDENIRIQMCIHNSCVNNMRSFGKFCLEEIKKHASLVYSESNALTLVNKIRNMFEQLLVLYKNKTCNGLPNIFLNLCNGKTVVSKCQIQIRNLLYSNILEFKGKFCGQIKPWFLTNDKKENVFDGILETAFWIGPYADFNLGLNQISGMVLNKCTINDQPCSQYKCKLFDQTLLQLKVHISQAALTEKCYKKYGQLNLMIRVIFYGNSMTTEVINSRLWPFWNISISFKPIVYMRFGDMNNITPIYAIFQLCNLQIKKKELVENVIAFTVLNIKQTETNSHNTLDWFDIVDTSEKIGKLFMAIEIIKISNDLKETENDSYVPLLKRVQPAFRVYQINVLFWGLRQLKLPLREPFIRMYCSGLYVDSDIIKKVISFPNFPSKSNIKCIFNIELPEDLNLIPPIHFQLFTKNRLHKESIAVGMCTSQTMDHFLVPMISETEWKQLRNENPVHSVLEIEKEEEEEEEEKKVIEDKTIKNPNNKLLNNNNKLDSSPKFSFKLIYDFFTRTVVFFTPCCLKNSISWIFSFAMPILIFLFKTLVCICPCINEIIYWSSKKYMDFMDNFEDKYSKLIDNELNENENEFTWWTKYYGFKYQKNNFEKNKRANTFLKMSCKLLPNCACCKESQDKIYLTKHYSKIKSITIYDKELENIPEFEKFEDNIKNFEFSGLNSDDNKNPNAIAVLKANIYLYPEPINKDKGHSRKSYCTNAEFKMWPKLKSNAKCNIIVRVYILRAHNLHPSDIGGLSDPYVEIIFGKSRRISDYNNYIPKSLNPMFGRCYEREVSLPECSDLKIRIMDYDRIGKNELIGETTIDIESRYYSKYRARCGLPNRYNKDGYNCWRDNENPTNILHKLCTMHSLKPPVYTINSVTVGSKQFSDPDENIEVNRQSLALYTLNHWQEMPVIGYRLVPEHVETRTLYNPDMPNIHRGTLEMWIDMFAKDDIIPAMVDVKPPAVERYELRVTIWSVVDVQLVDDNYFTGEKYSDIYIKGWLPGIEKQSTDIHYRSVNGEGLFNWRFKFPFSYNKTENIIVHNEKYLFSWYDEEQHFLPRLNLQIWDNDRLSPDSYIGFLNLDLWNMPKGSRSPWQCTTSNSVPRMNLFKVKKTRGWWPFVSIENNKNSIVGKLDAEIQIITKQGADALPVGLGRNGPQPLPEPKRPSTHYMKKFTDPFTFVFRRLFMANKQKFITGLIIVPVVLFVLLFIYAIPGYAVKKIMNA